MNKNFLILTGSAMLLQAQAGFSVTPFSYNYVELAYSDRDIQENDVNSDQLSLIGSFEVTESIILRGTYGSSRSEDFQVSGFRGSIEGETVGLGGRYRVGLSESADLYFSAGIVSAQLEGKGDFSGVEEEDEGLVLGLGLTTRVFAAAELTLGVSYDELFDDEDVVVGVGAQFPVVNNVLLGVDVSRSDDADSIGASVRFQY